MHVRGAYSDLLVYKIRTRILECKEGAKNFQFENEHKRNNIYSLCLNESRLTKIRCFLFANT